MLFVFGQVLEVLRVTEDIYFLWTPKEPKLFVCQLVELVVLDFVISSDSNAT
jgi:hypothetical protein